MRQLFSFLLFLLIPAGIIYLFADAKSARNTTAEKLSRDELIRTTAVSADSLPALPDSLAADDTILVAWKSQYRMRLYHKGKPVKNYIIGLGQQPTGHKQMQGDNRTPEGDYKIIQKSRGPFAGDYSQYLGVAWMRINYPNNADAINGFNKKRITEAQKNAIIKANNSGKEPPKNTKLGGGIGIHGWWGEWPGDDQQNLTWGCISVQNPELDDLYRRVNLGTRIVIFP